MLAFFRDSLMYFRMLCSVTAVPTLPPRPPQPASRVMASTAASSKDASFLNCFMILISFLLMVQRAQRPLFPFIIPPPLSFCQYKKLHTHFFCRFFAVQRKNAPAALASGPRKQRVLAAGAFIFYDRVCGGQKPPLWRTAPDERHCPRAAVTGSRCCRAGSPSPPLLLPAGRWAGPAHPPRCYRSG